MEKSYKLTSSRVDKVNPSIDNDTSYSPLEKEEPQTSTARLEFNTKDMRRFMNDRGIKVLWEQAYLCPCLNTKTGAPRIDCPRCHGSGIAYLLPKETVMAIQSQGKGVSVFDLGIMETGTAIGTTQLEHRVSYRDRFTVPDVVMPQHMIFLITEDRVKKGISLVYDTKEIIYITTDERVLYEEDYTVKDNRLYLDKSFIGQNVSLKIYMTLRYTVSDILKESRYQYTQFNEPQTKFENLPQKLLLKREDVFVKPEAYKPKDGINEDIQIDDVIDDPKAKPTSQENKGGFFGGVF